MCVCVMGGVLDNEGCLVTKAGGWGGWGAIGSHSHGQGTSVMAAAEFESIHFTATRANEPFPDTHMKMWCGIKKCTGAWKFLLRQCQ